MIARRDPPPAGDGVGIPAQFVGQDRRLEIVDAGVGPPFGAVAGDDLVGPGPVVAHGANPSGDLVVVGDQRPGVAEPAQGLGRIEAERPPGPEPAGRPAVQLRAQGLGGVLEHLKAVAFGDIQDLVHGADPAIDVHRHDGAGGRRDRRLHRLGRDQPVIIGALDRDRYAAGEMDRLGGGDKAVGREDDLRARLQPAGPEPEQHGVGAVRQADGVLDAEIGLQPRLELVDRVLQDEPTAGGGVTKDAGVAIRPFRVERLPVEKGRRQAFSR